MPINETSRPPPPQKARVPGASTLVNRLGCWEGGVLGERLEALLLPLHKVPHPTHVFHLAVPELYPLQ